MIWILSYAHYTIFFFILWLFLLGQYSLSAFLTQQIKAQIQNGFAIGLAC